jgi:hypothetical protein
MSTNNNNIHFNSSKNVFIKYSKVFRAVEYYYFKWIYS